MDLRIENLNQQYKGGKHALKDVNLSIGNGMFGLLGPNGAGKSTLMRILVTLMKPTSGKVYFNDYELQINRKEIRQLLGYLPQDFRFFSKLKTWEFLDYSARLTGFSSKKERRARVDEMLESVGLTEARNRQASKLSGGMKRRLGIAQALVGYPKIVVVDEPTTGLDPEERIRFRNLLSDLSQQDIIIILSTHIVGDISSTCEDMALLNKGQLLFKGAPDLLIEKAKGHVWEITATDEQLNTIKERYPVIATVPGNGVWDIQIVADEITGYDARPLEPNLEHAYMYFMEYEAAETDSFIQSQSQGVLI